MEKPENPPLEDTVQKPVAPTIPSEFTPPAQVPANQPYVEGNTSETDEKRKEEVVGELFQPKEAEVMPEISMHSQKSSRPIILWAIITLVAALVVGGGIFVMKNGQTLHLPSIVAVPTPTPTKTPTPTPSPTPTISDLKKDSLNIQVLNGGGTPGAATKMKQLLESKGYTVGATGNTDTYTYDQTIISVKSSKQAYLQLLESDLTSSYTLGTSSADLADDVSYDARVIVGK